MFGNFNKNIVKIFTIKLVCEIDLSEIEQTFIITPKFFKVYLKEKGSEFSK